MEDPKRYRIFLLGKPTFQNSVLSTYLNQTTQHQCKVVEQIPPLPIPEEILLLIDAQDCCPFDMLQSLDQRVRFPESARVGLLNVQVSECPPAIVELPFLKGIFPATDHTQLVQGIEAIFRGESWLPRRLLMAHIQNSRRHRSDTPMSALSLTSKEIEILTLLAAGYTNNVIADHMKISIHTVKTHIYNLFKKIKVSNRTQATNWANRNLDSDKVRN